MDGTCNILTRVNVCVQAESADLVAYGLIPEFIGRFPVLVSLTALTEDQLVRVILHIIVGFFPLPCLCGCI